MALIVCPCCGKNVSDTAEKCIHCGFDFRLQAKESEQSEKREYTNLTEYERNRLKNEFDVSFSQFANINKNYEKTEKADKVLGVFTIFFGLSLIASLIIFRIVKLNFESVIAYIVVIYTVFAFLFCAVKLIFWDLFFYKKRKRNHLAYLKKYRNWLKDEKNIEYDLTLTKQERKIFNGIFLENYFN